MAWKPDREGAREGAGPGAAPTSAAGPGFFFFADNDLDEVVDLSHESGREMLEVEAEYEASEATHGMPPQPDRI